MKETMMALAVWWLTDAGCLLLDAGGFRGGNVWIYISELGCQLASHVPNLASAPSEALDNSFRDLDVV